MATPRMSSSGPINLRIRHAVVSSAANAPDQSLAVNLPVDLLVAFDPTAMTAIFRLRAELGVQSLPLQNRNSQTTVYLAIAPERVASLVQDWPATLPKHVAVAAPTRLIGAKTPPMCWHFTLKRAGSVLVPREQSIVPRGEADARTWDAFRRLTECHTFAVYFDPAQVQQPTSALSSLCEVATSGKLKSSPKHLDLGTLYNGRGAVSLDRSGEDFGEDEVGATSRSSTRPTHSAILDIDDASTASPPSYDELGPRPPSPPHHPRKRLRTSSSAFIQSEGRLEDDEIAEAANGLTKLLDRAAQAQETLTRAVERAAAAEERLQSRITELEATNIRLRERLQEITTHIAQSDQSLDQTEFRNEMTEYVDGRLEEVRDEIEDILDVRIDDAKIEIKLELQEEVEERLKQAEEEIKETIQQRRISLVFED